MAMFRSFFFSGTTAWHITSTISKIHELYSDYDVMEPHVYESIISDLTDLHYNVHTPEFILDPYSGILTEIHLWFAEYGVEEGVQFMYESDSVATFELTDDEKENEEPITDEEEEELVQIATYLRNLGNHD